MVGKYALICAMEIQKIDRYQGAFWVTNKRVQIKILSILKLVSFESLAGNGFSLWKKPQSPTVKYLDEKYCIAVEGIFVGIIIKAGGIR